MKYRINAVRVAGAKPSKEDVVISHQVIVTRTYRIKTVGDATISIRKLTEILTQTLQAVFNPSTKANDIETG